MSHLYHNIEFVRSDTSAGEAVIATNRADDRTPLFVWQAVRRPGEGELISAALAAMRQADRRYRFAQLPFAGAALVLDADGPVARAQLIGRVGARLQGARMLAVADAGFALAEISQVIGTADGRVGGRTPAEWTAYGIFVSIQSLLASVGRPLEGASIAVQGVGAVGMELCRLLDAAGAVLFVSDPRRERVRQATLLFGAIPVDPGRAHLTHADVFAPCAADVTLDADDAGALGAKIVIGAADGVFTDEALELLHHQGVTVAPDFVVNAGGAIAAAVSALGEKPDTVLGRVEAIGSNLCELVRRAQHQCQRPDRVACAALPVPAMPAAVAAGSVANIRDRRAAPRLCWDQAALLKC